MTQEVNRLIHSTFITPIDREQIHTLINTMDDVADLIQDSAETMALYDVRHMTEEITRLTDLSVRCCQRVKEAVALLGQLSDQNCAQAALIMARVSAGDLTAVLPKPKKIGGVPAAIHDATSSSASIGNSIVSAPTKGRWPFHFAHSAASPGKQTSS